jgi:mannose-6-phosphate isomerase-like protein (cupin superfamily)
MRFRYVLMFVVLASFVTTSQVRAATTVQKVEKDNLKVTETTLNPGESATFADHLPSVVVYFSGNAAAVGGEHSQSVRRGETVFVPQQAAGIRDSGSEPLHFVRVAFTGQGSNEVWGMKGLPPNYKMIFENRYTRTYDIRIPAHFQEPLHTHHDRIVVCLSGAKLEHVLPNGKVQPSTLTTGEVVWRPGQTHQGHNLGNTNLWVIAIEPK